MVYWEPIRVDRAVYNKLTALHGMFFSTQFMRSEVPVWLNLIPSTSNEASAHKYLVNVVHFYAQSREMMRRWELVEREMPQWEIQWTIDFWNRKTYAQSYWDPETTNNRPKRQRTICSTDDHYDKDGMEAGALSPTKRRKSSDLSKYVKDMTIDHEEDGTPTPLDKGKQPAVETDSSDLSNLSELDEPGEDPQGSGSF
ncbi:hypothetical protein F5X99DRAFT_406464 [Biscogniauxia marginata]|nr:hypothetical protein F5X99DRAFT_406464 [Biscogniauxia marginata]